MKFSNIHPLAYSLFDYIMNVHQAYELLGESVGFLHRRAIRHHRTMDQEIFLMFNEYKIPRWWKIARQAVDVAQQDHLVAFKDEKPLPEWLNSSHLLDVMKLAVRSLDRWK